MGAVNPSPVQRSTWYRARKPLHAMMVIVLLSLIAGLVWVGVLNRPDPTAGGCQSAAEAVAPGSSASPAPVTPGQRLPPDGLDAVPPAPPQLVVVQVLNANGERGEAGVVAAELAELGFVPTAEPTNDPLHPAFDLHCHGEIRFGAAGEAAARTLSLAVPCAELVRDGRPTGVIDLALGTEFTRLRPNDAAREVLQGLVLLGQPVVGTSQGGQAAGLVAPAIDPDLLRQARAVKC
ncbi:MAG: envelope integrity protein Cei [Pseudonocardiaceae bacterium]